MTNHGGGMRQQCELPDCRAFLVAGNAPFTRVCPVCGCVYAADTDYAITCEEMLALLNVDELAARAMVDRRSMYDMREGS